MREHPSAVELVYEARAGSLTLPCSEEYLRTLRSEVLKWLQKIDEAIDQKYWECTAIKDGKGVK